MLDKYIYIEIFYLIFRNLNIALFYSKTKIVYINKK